MIQICSECKKECWTVEYIEDAPDFGVSHGLGHWPLKYWGSNCCHAYIERSEEDDNSDT